METVRALQYSTSTDYKEQAAIADILSDMDAEIVATLEGKTCKGPTRSSRA